MTSIKRALAALAVLAVLAFPHYAGAAGSTTVNVLMGTERPGSERRACAFQDGIFIMRGEISEGRVIVADPLNREKYRSDRIPALENYGVQQLGCLRSAQSGNLVVVVAGFYAGTRTQQPMVLATGYPIAEPVTHEEYKAGVR